MVKPTATAASTALPPRLRMSAPIRLARASWVTTMPWRAVTASTGGKCCERGSICACAGAWAQMANSRIGRRARRGIANMARAYPKPDEGGTVRAIVENIGRMGMLMRRAVLAGLAAATMLGIAPASSQSFTKQVHIIVPYGPGGTSDILARIIGPKLSEAIGQPVIVENKPSSSGNIGADFVAKSAPDGHTLLITDVGTLATQPSLVRRLAFDVQKDLVPVGMVMFSPYLFAVHPSLPVKDFKELLAYDKANPGKLNVGNSGVGSIQHLLAIVIAKKYGIKWGMVPYRGGAPAVRAVVSNESNVIFNGALATMPFVVQGQLKGIAVSGDQRVPR